MKTCDGLQKNLKDILEELHESFEVLDMPTESRRAATLASMVTTDRPAKLVVVGEFNSGKSTLLNALCGWDLLPMGITPTTATINIISHADTARIDVVRNDGGVTELPFGQEALRQLTARNGDQADVREVRVGAPGVPPGLVFIDTPGVNDVNQTRSEIVYQMIPEADALLFLMDVEQALKKSEVIFLRDRVLASSMVKTIFVLNHIDRVSKSSEIDAVVAHVRANLFNIYSAVADSLAGSGCELLASEVRKYASDIPIFTVSAKTMMRSAIASQEMAGDPMGLRSTVFQFASPEVRMKTLLAGAIGQTAPLIARLRQEVNDRKAIEGTARAGILSALHQDSEVLRKTLLASKAALGTVEVRRRELIAEANRGIDTVFTDAASGLASQVATQGAERALQAVQQEIARRIESQMEALNERIRKMAIDCTLKASAFIPLPSQKPTINTDPSPIDTPHLDWTSTLEKLLTDPVYGQLLQMLGFGVMMVNPVIGLVVVALPIVTKLFGEKGSNLLPNEMGSRILQSGREIKTRVTGALNDRMDLITTTVLDILDEPQQRIRTGCAALSGGERMSEATLAALSTRATQLDAKFEALPINRS
jgi:small GTP-binding protein